MRIKKNINWWIFHLIKYQILQTKIISSVWQRVRRIAEEIMGVKGLCLIQGGDIFGRN